MYSWGYSTEEYIARTNMVEGGYLPKVAEVTPTKRNDMSYTRVNYITKKLIFFRKDKTLSQYMLSKTYLWSKY